MRQLVVKSAMQEGSEVLKGLTLQCTASSVKRAITARPTGSIANQREERILRDHCYVPLGDMEPSLHQLPNAQDRALLGSSVNKEQLSVNMSPAVFMRLV